ncbi:hypothetical protein QZH41_016205, partial [Actinostola sp. cb2023]
MVEFLEGEASGNMVGFLEGKVSGEQGGILRGEVSGNMVGFLEGEVSRNMVGFLEGEVPGEQVFNDAESNNESCVCHKSSIDVRYHSSNQDNHSQHCDVITKNYNT